MSRYPTVFSVSTRRPPHGGRGLKSLFPKWVGHRVKLSPSPRRAWIEIKVAYAGNSDALVALPTEGVD